MRKEFSNTVETLASVDDRLVFITGDLGFNAFENLQKILGNRFINAGVAEQSMVSLAAGMASRGFKVICYSIAPFIVYRPLEQIRNDVCLHKMPVFLVGNGGGYGYGIMGSTHHALSDLACLGSLPNITSWIPAFTDDVPVMLREIIRKGDPAYMRLGAGKSRGSTPVFSGQFHFIIKTEQPLITIIVLGPLVSNVLEALEHTGRQSKADVFTVVNFPIADLSEEVRNSIGRSRKVMVVEEHVAQGGLAQAVAFKLALHNLSTQRFVSLHARGYPSWTYGDQHFHQQESGLDTDGISRALMSLF